MIKNKLVKFIKKSNQFKNYTFDSKPQSHIIKEVGNAHHFIESV